MEAMRAVLQRVTEARVKVDGAVVGEIGAGLVALVAVGREDAPGTPATMAEKIINLRIFNDEQGKMNQSLVDTGGAVLGNFAVHALRRCARAAAAEFSGRGRRRCRQSGLRRVCRRAKKTRHHRGDGNFSDAHVVELVNDGPTTILLDSDKTF